MHQLRPVSLGLQLLCLLGMRVAIGPLLTLARILLKLLKEVRNVNKHVAYLPGATEILD